MSFSFIHTGDWHIGKPFGRFEADKAALLREARARIVDRVGELSRRVGAHAVLVAGDVFDSPMTSDSVLRKLGARLEQFADMQWHFLPGNHDPATPNGVWQRFARFAGGDHIVIHHEAGLHHFKAGVDLLAAPLHARAIAHDPTGWMVERPSADNTIRIGLAHGAVQGFGSAGEASVLIAQDRAQSAKLDYLALGDWHGARQAGVRAWYAGTPEPDQYPDNEPGYALHVTIDAAGAEPRVERHRLGQYEWRRCVLHGDLQARLDEVEKELVEGGGEAANVLLKIELNGRVNLDDEFILHARVERLGDLSFYVHADYSGLVVDSGAEVAERFADPLIGNVARRLAEAMARGGDDGEVAHQALLMLTGIARDQRLDG